jgi:glutathione synthase/RimK-type ligase-like ATP-grasp enzyme
MPRIALVTARAAEFLDTDLAPLATALERAGADPAVTCWDDASVNWAGFDAVVLRSAWDYPQRLEEFLEWIDATSRVSQILNSPATVEWNSAKRYLADLAGRGIPVVPTLFVSPGDDVDLPDDVELVVKPVVSAGAKDTARFEAGDRRAAAFAGRLLGAGRDVMVQPYQSAVDSVGEHALVCFDGRFSHAFNKGPILRRGAPPAEGLYADEVIGPADVSDAEVKLAERAVAVAAGIVGDLPVYARVDLVPGDDGDPLLLELELIEPSVYHHVAEASAERFAAAILTRLRTVD